MSKHSVRKQARQAAIPREQRAPRLRTGKLWRGWKGHDGLWRLVVRHGRGPAVLRIQKPEFGAAWRKDPTSGLIEINVDGIEFKIHPAGLGGAEADLPTDWQPAVMEPPA